MKKYLLPGLALLTACSSAKRDTNIQKKEDTLGVKKSELFTPVDTSYTTTSLVLPKGFSYTVLFSEGDTVVTASGQTAPAKGKHDFVSYIPIDKSSEHGYLYISHEARVASATLGDGGGGTVLEIKKTGGAWKVVGPKRNVNFLPVGGTINNCGGTQTPSGMILTAEEMEPANNSELSNSGKSFTDLKDFGGMKRHENMGWMVLVDPLKAEAKEKVYNFGRYVHEDAHCLPDGKTVFLTDDNCPAVLFKFETEQPNDYSKGQLFAYKQSADGNSGEWLKLPMDMPSLKNARNVAIGMGATMFVRQEWIDGADGKLYITETGTDQIDYNAWVKRGGTVPNYLEKLKTGTNTYSDPYGRVLVLDLATNKIAPLVEGGSLKDGGFFSNPDGMTLTTQNGRNYLVINEDIIELTLDRVTPRAAALGEAFNEIYLLDLGIAQPTREDLRRFAVGPRGCETTGSWFTPDGKTYFISVQSPSKDNPPPFNKSCTVAITGF